MKEDFLLNSQTAKKLYSFVKDFPIIDYHNHLSVSDISENKRFSDIYDLWIKPDPYKHRAMRMCGVEEKYITGDAPDFEKFKAWCTIYPKLIGNPLYIWTQMELMKVFGITDIPNESNAEEIYNKANSCLAENIITPKTLLERFNVELACPCVSLADDVSCFWGEQILSPSLRGDDITSPDSSFIQKLGGTIANLDDYKNAVIKKLCELKSVGCVFSDHALDNGFKYCEDDGKNEARFNAVLKGDSIDKEEKARLTSYILTFLLGEYARQNFTVQLHIGAQRYTSTRLRKLAGAAGGFAGIGNSFDVESVTTMLDTVEKGEYGLPKIMIFTLNPADNAITSVLSGSYSKDGVSGLITQGPAWWWCDHKYGIDEALENMASFSLLSNFVGMTTDSRSFLSFVRHDYFRRILCSWLAGKLDNNELCAEADDLVTLLKKMCYKNAKNISGGIEK